MTPFRHVIWDWNGTLLDDAWLCVEITGSMLRDHAGEPLTLERYQRLFGFPVIDYYRRIGFDFDKQPFEVVANEFIARYNARCRLCRLQNDAEAVLRHCGSLGLDQFILSAYHHAALRGIVRHHGLDRYFRDMAGLEDHYAHGKTDVGRRLIARHGLDPAFTLLVGDTIHDHEVATELGLRAVLIPAGHQSLDRLEATGSTVLPSLAHLSGWLSP